MNNYNILLDNNGDKKYSEFLELLVSSYSNGNYNNYTVEDRIGKYVLSINHLVYAGYFSYEGPKMWQGEWSGLSEVNSLKDVLGIKEFELDNIKKKSENNDTFIDYEYLDSIIDKSKISKAKEIQEDAVRAFHQKVWSRFVDEMLTDKEKSNFQSNFMANNIDESNKILLKALKIGIYLGEYDKAKVTISGILALLHTCPFDKILNIFKKTKSEDVSSQYTGVLKTFEGFDTQELYNYSPFIDSVVVYPQYQEIPVENIKINIENYKQFNHKLGVPNFYNKNHEISLDAKDPVVIPEIDFGSFDGKAVCDGAVFKCTKGSAPSNLSILPIKQIFLNDKPIAVVSDTKPMVNIKPFGVCLRQQYPPPCTPNISGKWDNEIKHFICSEPTASTKSTCKCSFGGTISIVQEGQTGIGYASFSAESEEDGKENKKEENKYLEPIKIKIEKVIEQSLASVEAKIDKPKIYREMIVKEAKYWVDILSYYKDDLIKTSILDKKNPPSFMDEAEFTSSVYLTVTGINIGENMFMQMNRGKEISKNSLLEGDLLFFDWDINGIGEKIPDLYVLKAMRIIQDDGTYFNTDKDTKELADL